MNVYSYSARFCTVLIGVSVFFSKSSSTQYAFLSSFLRFLLKNFLACIFAQEFSPAWISMFHSMCCGSKFKFSAQIT